MTYIDLTHTFTAHMPVYPGDPRPALAPTAQLDADGFRDHELKTSMHVGTHMDSPAHMIADGKLLSEIPVDRFVGPGRLLDARGRDEVGAELLDDAHVSGGDIVIVMTGWSERFGDASYFDAFPVLTEAFARGLADRSVSIVGMDTPSPDRSPFPVHHILLGSEILIIENLTNVDALLGAPAFTVTALPAKLQADAAPVRVIAEVQPAS